jgi:programmed cell death 8 (apoptosis-inducing factor)
MNFVKATTYSARFIQKRGISGLKTQLGCTKSFGKSRLYSTSQHVTKEKSNVPWVIGSILIFGPILFKLTSPPEKKKVEHIIPAVVEEEEQEEAEEEAVQEPAVKKVQNPYVLVGAGTASFAAAQAIKEKDLQANVS